MPKCDFNKVAKHTFSQNTFYQKHIWRTASDFVASNQKFTYRKLNFHVTSSIYLVFLPTEMQKSLKQTKVYHTFFYFVRKETKTVFSSVYVIGTTCFDECFLFFVLLFFLFFSSFALCDVFCLHLFIFTFTYFNQIVKILGIIIVIIYLYFCFLFFGFN